MTYYILPRINNNNIYFDIKYKSISQESKLDLHTTPNNICDSLSFYLNDIKKQITDHKDYWDIIKKLTNPYEYIHTIIPNYKISVCKYKPISRAFFKMIEIINVFNLLDENEKISTFHLAEGPGGFVEAFGYIRNNSKDIYYGMTLVSSDTNIPSWKKTTGNFNKNFKIENGITGTGDLFDMKNLIYCHNKYRQTMDYITGDGGFDFSNDFNNQEEQSFKLVFSQVCFNLVMQKDGGCFVLKIFDIFKTKTIEIIYLLSCSYDTVHIYKPSTSRVANSEKYIICKNYKSNNNIIDYILNNYDNMLNNNIESLFDIKIPKIFLNKIQELNSIYGQQQLENINYTLNIIREFININYKLKLINNDKNQLYKYLLYFNDLKYDISNNQTQHINKELRETRDAHDYCINYLDILKLNNDSKMFKTLQSKLTTDESIEIFNTFFNKLKVIININIQKSIQWCKKNNFQINKEFEK